MNEQNRKIKLMIIGVAILVIGLVGITYAFFNYTRTGAINNLGTGRIAFSSSQSDTLNITNYFPMKSNEVNSANLDSVTISITGDTTYADGEEYKISIVDVNNTVNGKAIPMNYIATYTAASGGTIGTSSSDYWEDREDKDASIYILNATGEVVEGNQILVGYIDNGSTGINGTLTIKAYIDADRIAISDTYPAENGPNYIFNTNVIQSEIDNCVNYLYNYFDVANYPLSEGDTLESFCSGTGTIDNYTFQEWIKNNWWYDENINYFLEHNIIVVPGYTDDTTSEWVNGRTVFTTEEWNSIQSTPISFKIRAESNEGIWVPEGIATCRGCKFMYVTDYIYTIWNSRGQNPTVVTTGLSDDYNDIIESSEREYFLGVRLNSNNQIINAYACGLYSGTSPYCIEGYYDNSKYSRNREIVQNTYLPNGACYHHDGEETHCVDLNQDLNVTSYYDGGVMIRAGNGGNCAIDNTGEAICYDEDPN